MQTKYDIRRKRMYFLLITIFSLVGLGVLTIAVFPYQIISEPLVDNPTNYLLNELIFSFLALGIIGWIFVFAYLIGKSVGEDNLEESA